VPEADPGGCGGWPHHGGRGGGPSDLRGPRCEAQEAPAASARASAQARSTPGGGGGPPQLKILRVLELFRGRRRSRRGRVEDSHLCRRTRGPEAKKLLQEEVELFFSMSF
jgi:hypothetical protein